MNLNTKTILKNRKTPLQSKRKVVVMMELFEKMVDEKIVLIDVELGRVQTPTAVYKINIDKNTIEKLYKIKYEINDFGDFD